MNIAYFPFTHIDELLAAAVFRRFGRFTVYCPVSGHEPGISRVLADRNRIDLRCPVAGEESLVMNLCRSFRSWGAMHQGRAGGLKQFAESGFYNDQFAAEIRSEILKDDGNPSRQELDPIRNARVFLQLAQEFDMEQAEIESRLSTAGRTEKKLFAELRGDDYEPEKDLFSGTPEDAGAFMTESRMAAWSLLVGNGEFVPEAFLTSSRVVLDLLFDRFPSLVHVGGLRAAPGGTDAERIAGIINLHSRTPWEGPDAVNQAFDFPDAPADDGFRAEIYVLPDLSPVSVIRSFADLPDRSAMETADVRNCFICLVSADR